MTFSEALVVLKSPGGTIYRSEWNGKGMFLFLVDQWTFSDSTNLGLHYLPLHDFIAMKTADGIIVPWLASQTDILAEDWEGTLP